MYWYSRYDSFINEFFLFQKIKIKAEIVLSPGGAYFQKVSFATVFLRIEVAPDYRPPIRSRVKPENFILKTIAYHISSNIGREGTTGKTYMPHPVFEEIQ